MSVRKRTLDSNEIRWQCDYRDQGKKRRSKQFKTKREADAYEIKVGAEIATGVHVADSASATLQEAGNLWLKECRAEELEASTLQQYEQHLRLHILPLLGSTLKLSKLTKPMFKTFRMRLLETRSRAMTRKVLTSLKSILSHAQEGGLVGQNVALGGKRTKKSNRHAIRIEEATAIPLKEEIRTLIAKTAEIWPSSLPHRAIVITALFSGLRASELRGLTWDHVDFEGKLIRVRQRADFRGEMGSPKSAAGSRDVPMAPMVFNALRQWKLVCPPSMLNLVFPTSAGTIITNSNLHRQCWHPLLRAADLLDAGKPRYRFHDLRHAAASLFIEQGWQPKKVMTVLGHGSVSLTFDTYGHLWKTLEDEQKAMEQIEKRLFG